MKGMGKKTGLMALAFLCALGLMPGQAQAEPRTIRVQSVYPETSHGPQMLVKWAEKVHKYTNNQVNIQLFWPGMLVGVADGFDAVGKGTVQGLYSTMIYYGGTVPEGKVEWLPFTWQDPQEAHEFYTKAGFLEMMRQAMASHGVYYLFPLLTADMGFITNFPVSSLEDFKGRKLRATGPDGPVAKAAGAAAVSIPSTDMYTSLQRGTVDGIIYPFYTLSTYKLNEVAKYIVLPGVHTPSVTGVYLNLKTWNELPEEIRRAMEKAGMEVFLETVEKSAQWDQEVFEQAKKLGVQIQKLPPADVAKFRALCRPQWDKVAEATPLSKQMVDLLVAFLTKKGAL